MDTNSILRTARIAGWDVPDEWDESDGFLVRLRRFAVLAIVAEREECANIPEMQVLHLINEHGGDPENATAIENRRIALEQCARAIRAKGNGK